MENFWGYYQEMVDASFLSIYRVVKIEVIEELGMEFYASYL
jgi:hypothetical protein